MNSPNGSLPAQATDARSSKRGGQKKTLPDSTDSFWSEHPNTRALLNALATLKSGDFSIRLPLDWVGIAGKVADTFNEVVALNQRMSRELGRLRESVGREGRIDQRASLGEVEGIASVTGAVANGDLAKKITVDVKGEQTAQRS